MRRKRVGERVLFGEGEREDAERGAQCCGCSRRRNHMPAHVRPFIFLFIAAATCKRSGRTCWNRPDPCQPPRPPVPSASARAACA